jgi:uncharacterized membrane protein YfcA
MAFLALYFTIGFGTSLISGVFGLLGGMVLMIVLLKLMSLPAAMFLSALSQLLSNGARCWLWRKHIVYSVLPPYFAGIGTAVVIVTMIAFVPDKGMAFFLMGILPLIARILKPWVQLDIQKKSHAFVGATFLAFVQLLSGVIGPLLDLLYVNSNMTRHQIISTKAFTQVGMHLVRLFYYGTFAAMLAGEWVWPAELAVENVILCLLGIMGGTYASTFIVNRMGDALFRRILNALITIVSVYCLYQAAMLWGWFN